MKKIIITIMMMLLLAFSVSALDLDMGGDDIFNVDNVISDGGYIYVSTAHNEVGIGPDELYTYSDNADTVFGFYDGTFVSPGAFYLGRDFSDGNKFKIDYGWGFAHDYFVMETTGNISMSKDLNVTGKVIADEIIGGNILADNVYANAVLLTPNTHIVSGGSWLSDDGTTMTFNEDYLNTYITSIASDLNITVVEVPTNDFGLTLDLEEFEYHEINGNLTLFHRVYNTKTGVEIVNGTCNSKILIKQPYELIVDESYTYDEDVTTINSTNFDTPGTYTIQWSCSDEDNKNGGYLTFDFEVVENTTFGMWTPVTDWTFPIIYLVITFIIIMVGLIYTSSIIGVLGSVMLMLSYFMIGATSPLLLSPLLIIGLLLAFKFSAS